MIFNSKKPDESLPQDFVAKRPFISVAPEPMPGRKPSGATTRSVIDAWLTITGNLQSEGEVQVDGQVQGDIHCAHLTVGKDASIAGNIVAEEVVVRGKVKGTIRANRVILQDSAQVDSEIFHKRLAIEEGARFDGVSRMREEPMMAEEPTRMLELQAVAVEMKAGDKAAKNGATAAA